MRKVAADGERRTDGEVLAAGALTAADGCGTVSRNVIRIAGASDGGIIAS